MLIILCICSCRTEEYHYEVHFKNNSSSTVSISLSLLYPDTTITCPLGHVEVSPGNEYSDYIRCGWEEALENTYYQLFIINTEIVDTVPCDTISKNNLILRRYQLSVNELDNMNWFINYP